MFYKNMLFYSDTNILSTMLNNNSTYSVPQQIVIKKEVTESFKHLDSIDRWNVMDTRSKKSLFL